MFSTTELLLQSKTHSRGGTNWKNKRLVQEESWKYCNNFPGNDKQENFSVNIDFWGNLKCKGDSTQAQYITKYQPRSSIVYVKLEF